MGQFGIGIYQSMSGGTVVDNGAPATSQGAFSLTSPLAGTYGGTYGFVIDTTIRAPVNVGYTPAPEIAMDSLGYSVVRSYPSMVWGYTTLRPDYWYYLLNLYRQSSVAPAPFQYQVLLQYPDPFGSGDLLQTLARFDPPTFSDRDVGAYYGVTLNFTYMGQQQLDSLTPIMILS